MAVYCSMRRKKYSQEFVCIEIKKNEIKRVHFFFSFACIVSTDYLDAGDGKREINCEFQWMLLRPTSKYAKLRVFSV